MQPNKERHLKIKYELSLVGMTFTEIGRNLGVSHSAVMMVTSGRSRSHRIEQAIAEAISSSPEEIWPEWYRDNLEGAMR